MIASSLGRPPTHSVRAAERLAADWTSMDCEATEHTSRSSGAPRSSTARAARTVELTRAVGWRYPGRGELASIRRELARAAGRRMHGPR